VRIHQLLQALQSLEQVLESFNEESEAECGHRDSCIRALLIQTGHCARLAGTRIEKTSEPGPGSIIKLVAVAQMPRMKYLNFMPPTFAMALLVPKRRAVFRRSVSVTILLFFFMNLFAGAEFARELGKVQNLILGRGLKHKRQEKVDGLE
jgi:hypothetical protein